MKVHELLEPDLSSAILVRLRRSYEIDRLLNPDFDHILPVERACSNKATKNYQKLIINETPIGRHTRLN